MTYKIRFRPTKSKVVFSFFGWFLAWSDKLWYLSGAPSAAQPVNLCDRLVPRRLPQDVFWSIPPKRRPRGKHLTCWGITYQTEPGYVLVDSQELELEGMMRRGTYLLPTLVKLSVHRDEWPRISVFFQRLERLEREEKFREWTWKKGAKSVKQNRQLYSLPSGKRHLIWNERNLQDANTGNVYSCYYVTLKDDYGLSFFEVPTCDCKLKWHSSTTTTTTILFFLMFVCSRLMALCLFDTAEENNKKKTFQSGCESFFKWPWNKWENSASILFSNKMSDSEMSGAVFM